MNRLPEIKIVAIDDAKDFDSLKNVWNNLVEGGSGMSVFQTFDWNHCWWQAYGDEHKLLILKIESGGEIIGLAPLMISDGIVEFIGTPNADYCDIITTRPEICIGPIVDFLKQNVSRWNRIDLSQIPESSHNLPILTKGLEKSGMPYRLYPIENVMSYRYDGDDSGRPGFEMHKGGTIRKFINFFNKKDGLSLVGFDSPDEILKRLPEFYHSHIVWWFRRGGDGCKFLNQKVRRFHDLTAGSMAGQGQVRLYLLMHGDQTLAYLYAFLYYNTIYLYQIASLMNYRKKSPGILLLQLLVEAAVREGIDVVDFSRGAGEHKERFANQSGRNMQCTVYSSGFKKSLATIYAGLKDSAGGRKLKNLKPVRKLKDSLVKKEPDIYTGISNKTTSRIFAENKGQIGYDFYMGDIINFNDSVPYGSPTYSEVTPGDLDRIAAFVGLENESDEYAGMGRRIESGGRCFLACVDGHPAAVGWILNSGEMLPGKVAQSIAGKAAGFITDVGISPVFYTKELEMSLYRFLGVKCGQSGRAPLVDCLRDDRELAAILMDIGFRRI